MEWKFFTLQEKLSLIFSENKDVCLFLSIKELVARSSMDEITTTIQTIIIRDDDNKMLQFRLATADKLDNDGVDGVGVVEVLVVGAGEHQVLQPGVVLPQRGHQQVTELLPGSRAELQQQLGAPHLARYLLTVRSSGSKPFWQSPSGPPS